MIVLWILGIICASFLVHCLSLSSTHYLLAQAHRIHGKEKDPIGYFDDLSFMFNEGNYTEQGLMHRKKYFSYTGYATLSVFALIFIIIIGMFF